MAVYEYKAFSRAGKKVKGIIDADSPVSARRKLREQELLPASIEESFGKQALVATKQGGQKAGRESLSGRVSTRDLSMMTRQLGVLLHAGMPLVEALTSLMEQTQRPVLRKTILDVRDRVTEGAKLADGLGAHPRIFNALYINMVYAGESSGSLEAILFRLADTLEHQARVRNKVLSTLAYPMFMLVFAVGIIMFLVLVIVPKITELLTSQGQDLPALTQALINTTDFIWAWWHALIVGTLGVFFLWRYWLSRPQGRLKWDRSKLRVPVIGRLQQKLVSARFARTLGTMLQSGLTMMRALDVVSTVLQNKYVEKALEDVKAGVRRGRGLAEPMGDTGAFPPMLLSMIELGQRSGEMEDMLIRVADTYDEDVQLTIDALVSLLEPLIIIVMGIFVGLLVLSILLPILEMSSGVKV